MKNTEKPTPEPKRPETTPATDKTKADLKVRLLRGLQTDIRAGSQDCKEAS